MCDSAGKKADNTSIPLQADTAPPVSLEWVSYTSQNSRDPSRTTPRDPPRRPLPSLRQRINSALTPLLAVISLLSANRIPPPSNDQRARATRQTTW